MTPKFDSEAALEACTPLHWDAEEWDFRAWSEDDESLTNGKDLQFLLGGELEDEDDDDDESWDVSYPGSKKHRTEASIRVRMMFNHTHSNNMINR
jgi:hypothetical protein